MVTKEKMSVGRTSLFENDTGIGNVKEGGLQAKHAIDIWVLQKAKMRAGNPRGTPVSPAARDKGGAAAKRGFHGADFGGRDATAFSRGGKGCQKKRRGAPVTGDGDGKCLIRQP